MLKKIFFYLTAIIILTGCKKKSEENPAGNKNVKFQLKDRLPLFQKYDISEFYFNTDFDPDFFKANKQPMDTATSIILFGKVKPECYYYSFHAPNKKYVSFTYIDADRAEMNMVTLTESGEFIDEINVAGIYLSDIGNSMKNSRYINDSVLKQMLISQRRNVKTGQPVADTLITSIKINQFGKFEEVSEAE